VFAGEIELERYKYLLKNIGLLTVSSISTKLLMFLLVPLYTSILSTSDYGKYDFIQSTVGILVPILTLNMYEAVMRYAMDKNYSISDVFAVGIHYCIIGNLIVMFFLFVNWLLTFNAFIKEFSVCFFSLFFVNSLFGIISSAARGLGQIKSISISGVIGSSVAIFMNILCLCVFKWGLDGYFVANIMGILSQLVYLMVKIHCWTYLSLCLPGEKVKKEMLGYSIPTIANSVAWWVNGLADRYIIIFFCDMSVNGVYSVASKIPAILNVLQGIFSQAFILSAVKEFDADDREGFFRKTFAAYNFVLIILCSLIICFDKFLAQILYANEFFTAWKYVPFLTISIIFGSLSGYAGSIFATIKRSDYFFRCSGAGAVINILMNLILVPMIGALGAAIATTFSYWIVYMVSMYYLNKSMNVKLAQMKDNVAYLVLLFQSLMLLIEYEIHLLEYLIQFVTVIFFIVMYFKEIKWIVYKGT